MTNSVDEISMTAAQLRAAVLREMRKDSEQMTLSEVAKTFKRSQETIKRWVRNGDFPSPYYIGSQSYNSAYWDRKFILNWIKDKTRKANATAEELLDYDPTKVW